MNDASENEEVLLVIFKCPTIDLFYVTVFAKVKV